MHNVVFHHFAKAALSINSCTPPTSHLTNKKDNLWNHYGNVELIFNRFIQDNVLGCTN